MAPLAGPSRPWANTAADDDDLLAELYDQLERAGPKDTTALELILYQWEARGHIDAAVDIAKEILKRDPYHAGAREWIDENTQPPVLTPSTSAGTTTTAATSPMSLSPGAVPQTVPAAPLLSPTVDNTTSAVRTSRLRPARGMTAQEVRAFAAPSNKLPIPLDPPPETEEEMQEIESRIASLFADVQTRAAELEWDLLLLEQSGIDSTKSLSQDLVSLREGRVSAVVMPPPRARPVRQLVAELDADDWQQSLQRVVDDFVQAAQWALDSAEADTEASSAATSSQVAERPARLDIVRQRLRQRQSVLDALLPETLEGLGRTAVLHVEHELVLLGDKAYANSETMLGDAVTDIPLENLLVTADNYAWDMAELADALAANSAVMRNPLTRDMFDDADVRRILAHPLGQRLRPMALAQSELWNGVRPDTYTRIAALSKVMLEDQSAHATPTLEALDVFLAYMQTLPVDEQTTLKKLSIPAQDSHTGLAYNSTIFEAVQDAKANRVCFHKAGDFLKQAAEKLRMAKEDK